jgi:glycosyltransferase involved in cell wall biosynthesis
LNKKLTIVCFGPGPKFKGGIANYNVSLAKAFDKLGHKTHIVSWSQQYPAIIPREFVDKTSKSDLLEGTQITVDYLCNYNNPFSWFSTAKYIKSLNPDIVIFQWAIAIQGLPIGRIINWLNQNTNCTTIADLHFVIQKENSNIDNYFTKLGIQSAQQYVVHAKKTFTELQTLFPNKSLSWVNPTQPLGSPENQKKTTPVLGLYHPVYKLFPIVDDFDKENFKVQNGLKKYVFLYFGFIRKYKGLHNLIPAFAKLARKRDDVSLIICGESFWNTLDNKKWSTKLKKAIFGFVKGLFLAKKDSEENYNPLKLIDDLGIKDKVFVNNNFVPNEEVHKYFQASDAVMLYYDYATPSGVESLTYNFKLPVLATKVGHFPETIKEGYNGYLAEANNIDDMCAIMEKFIEKPINPENVAETAKDMSWENYAKAIINFKA